MVDGGWLGRNIDGSWHIHVSDDEAAFLPRSFPSLSLPPHVLDSALSSRRTTSSRLVQADIHSVGVLGYQCQRRGRRCYTEGEEDLWLGKWSRRTGEI